jgi:hypothetical protein
MVAFLLDFAIDRCKFRRLIALLIGAAQAKNGGKHPWSHLRGGGTRERPQTANNPALNLKLKTERENLVS